MSRQRPQRKAMPGFSALTRPPAAPSAAPPANDEPTPQAPAVEPPADVAQSAAAPEAEPTAAPSTRPPDGADGPAAPAAEVLPHPPRRRGQPADGMRAAGGSASGARAKKTAASGRRHAGDGLVYPIRQVHPFQLRVPPPLFAHYRQLASELQDRGISEASVNEIVIALMHHGPATADEALQQMRALREHREQALMDAGS